MWDDILVIQFFTIWSLMYLYFYNNIYYSLLYTFFNFFLLGIYLSIFQLELFTAFLWLIECSVLFVFLLLLFYLNIKGFYIYTYKQTYLYLYLCIYLIIVVIISFYYGTENNFFEINLFSAVDNYYESIYNPILNDLFGFSISYYFLNGFEFIVIGFLLLVGSVVCVNLYQMNKNIRVQNYSSFLTIFNFFLDFSSFFFLRRQNIVKQGNVKPSLRVFKRK